SSAAASAMLKHAASAAASSSSGLDPVAFSKRDPKLYEPASPDSPRKLPLPPLRPPFHTALDFLVGMITPRCWVLDVRCRGRRASFPSRPGHDSIRFSAAPII